MGRGVAEVLSSVEDDRAFKAPTMPAETETLRKVRTRLLTYEAFIMRRSGVEMGDSYLCVQ